MPGAFVAPDKALVDLSSTDSDIAAGGYRFEIQATLADGQFRTLPTDDMRALARLT